MRMMFKGEVIMDLIYTHVVGHVGVETKTLDSIQGHQLMIANDAEKPAVNYKN